MFLLCLLPLPYRCQRHVLHHDIDGTLAGVLNPTVCFVCMMPTPVHWGCAAPSVAEPSMSRVCMKHGLGLTHPCACDVQQTVPAIDFRLRSRLQSHLRSRFLLLIPACPLLTNCRMVLSFYVFVCLGVLTGIASCFSLPSPSVSCLWLAALHHRFACPWSEGNS